MNVGSAENRDKVRNVAGIDIVQAINVCGAGINVGATENGDIVNCGARISVRVVENRDIVNCRAGISVGAAENGGDAVLWRQNQR